MDSRPKCDVLALMAPCSRNRNSRKEKHFGSREMKKSISAPPNCAAHKQPDQAGEPDTMLRISDQDRHRALLEIFEIGARAENVPTVLEALLYCRENDVRAPTWLLEATFDLVTSLMRADDKKRGPGGNRLARCRQDMKHFIRWDFFHEVRRMQKKFSRKVKSKNPGKERHRPEYVAHWRAVHAVLGTSVDSARRAVSKILVGTAAAGSEEAIAKSVYIVSYSEPGRFLIPNPKVLEALFGLHIAPDRTWILERLGAPEPEAKSGKSLAPPTGTKAGK